MQAGSTARRRMGGETGERGSAGQRERVTRRRAEGTRRARGSSKEREHRNKKKTAGRADTQEGHIEVAGRGRLGEQGANEGAREHENTHREAPCR